uniref:peptidylprolyl isomerase n=1 Tax=Hirondellea gigas TaxID=1518452 RepID=A0A6A7FWL0_9CRUS
MMSEGTKRAVDDQPLEDEDDGWVGPRPTEAATLPPKKRKKVRVLPHEALYLSDLPSAEYYEKSFMHRDVVTHIIVTKTEFIITGSQDGVIKFWKKLEESIEFVKVFRCHLCPIKCLVTNCSGSRCATMGEDSTLKIFDVVNFDMINILKLDFQPSTCEFIHSSSDPQASIAVADSKSSRILIFDANSGDSKPIQILDSLHLHPVTLIKYNWTYDTAISCDTAGILEYWRGSAGNYKMPTTVKFRSKLDTDLFEFVKDKKPPITMCVAPTGLEFATLSLDRRIRVFKFITGKLSRVFDESVEHITDLQQRKPQIPNMEFGRRLAVEREVEKSGALGNLVYDASGYLLLYPTLLGVKVVNVYTNKLVRTIAKPENFRILQLALFQGKVNRFKSALSIEQEGSENPNLELDLTDPTLVATAFKKNRFYLFTTRDATCARATDADRDVFNEKPSKEDIIAATDNTEGQRIFETATIHTSMGDIHLKLFLKECPKSVENFCVHARNGYYNGHIFHRVIKQFMIQTGDPQGTGVGGVSIWGGEFEDEFHPSLRHDRPYTLSMANAGPNTNGSQFFVTLVPTPWLDKKHTVFGRVVRGMESVLSISNVKTNPKTDTPYTDVTIISITVK